MKVNFLAVLCLTSCLACVSNNTVFAMNSNVLENSKFDNKSGFNELGFDKSKLKTIQPNTLEEDKIELIDANKENLNEDMANDLNLSEIKEISKNLYELKSCYIEYLDKIVKLMQTELYNVVQEKINKIYDESLSHKKTVKGVVSVMNNIKSTLGSSLEKHYEFCTAEIENTFFRKQIS